MSLRQFTTCMIVGCLITSVADFTYGQRSQELVGPPELAQLARTPTSPMPGVASHARRLPEELADPVFDHQVDILLLGKAWQRHDAALLTDIGLVLAENERVMMRPRKGLDSALLLELAAYIAADRNDITTLERLDKLSARNANLGTRIAAARKIAERSRSAEHSAVGSIENLTPEGLAVHQAALRRIRSARLAGDIAALDKLDEHLDTRTDLHDSQRKHLDGAIAHAKSSVTKETDNLKSTIITLEKLAALAPSFRDTASPY